MALSAGASSTDTRRNPLQIAERLGFIEFVEPPVEQAG
jgi:hypothetical protein